MKPKILKIIFAVFSVLLFNNNVTFSQWFQLTTNTTETLQDILFINSNTGIAIGSNGKIIRSTDAGLTWYSVVSGTSFSLYSLSFPDNSTGFAGGLSGTVLRTLNSGSSWSPRTGCGININCISFIDVSTGITAGGGTLMCFTTNAGQTWNPRYSPSLAVTGVTFLNSTALLLSATDLPGAAIYKSTNTGYNFSTVLSLNNIGLDVMYSLNYIYFKDQSTGFCTGSRLSYGQTWGEIYRTTNGGTNWIVTGSAGPLTGGGLHGIHFGEASTGFAVGNNGVIMRSTNGGANWVSQSSSITNHLYSVFMLNAQTGYACGTSGMVLKTTNGGITGFIKSGGPIPNKFALNQNYPNPFNPVTRIKFEIPSNVKGQTSNVKLIIYDILGREVAVLVNEHLKQGSYEVEWDGSNYPSGAYIYKLQIEAFSETKKMVLVK